MVMHIRINLNLKNVDMYRECYLKKIIPPYGIEVKLYENEDRQRFVIADLTDEIQ